MKTRTLILLIIVFGIALAMMLKYAPMPQTSAPAQNGTSSAAKASAE